MALALFVSAAVVYLAFIAGHRTQFDYFGRLADAIWHGHLWLDAAPLSELDPGRDGHLYNVQPPLPALLLLPLVPFGPPAQIETFWCAFLGALTAFPTFASLRALDVPRRLAALCTVFALFGTVLFYTAIDGGSWFSANIAGTFFATVALWLGATRRSGLFVGAAIGAAALARPSIGLALPGLLLLAYRDEAGFRWAIRAAVLAVIGLVPFAAALLWYDWVRWGDPFSIYGPQARVLAEPLLSHGRNSVAYVPRHLWAMFFSGPALDQDSAFFLRPRATGMAILLGSPAYLWIARAAGIAWSTPAWRTLIISALPIMAVTMLVPQWGFVQYGYRYSLDYQAFLLPLLAVGAGWSTRGTGRWESPSRLFRIMVVLSVALTTYFVVTIKLFGFAS